VQGRSLEIAECCGEVEEDDGDRKE